MRKLLIAVVLLVLLLIGADFALRYIATKQIGEAVQTKLGLREAPSVSISGFPFVTQAINGKYDTISASLLPTTIGPLQNVSVNVDLIGTRIPLSDALSGNVNALTADSSQVRIMIPVASVATVVGLPDLTVQSSAGGLRITTTITVFDQQFPVSADLDARIVDSQLELRAGPPSGDGITLPANVSQAIGTLLSLDVPLSGLPFTVTNGSVGLAGSSLVLDATTSALSFAGN
jgi:hypothetical protein